MNRPVINRKWLFAFAPYTDDDDSYTNGASVVPASLQNVDEAFKVGVRELCGWSMEWRTPGLSCEVDHFGESMFANSAASRGRFVRSICTKSNRAWPRKTFRRCPVSTPDHSSRRDYPVEQRGALGLQLPRTWKPMKTRGSRDQYCLIRHCIPWMWI